MKNLKKLIVLLVLAGICACNSTSKKEENKNVGAADEAAITAKVEAIYFHFTRRCATCMAIEEETKKVLEVLYPNLVKAKQITFLSVNLDEESSKIIAEKYKVEEQTMLFICNNKIENLTNMAFMCAKENPAKWKEEIKKTIALLVKK